MPISSSKRSSCITSLITATLLGLFPALILSFVIPPILNLFPAVVLKAQNLVCPAGYHLDPFSLWSSLCTDGNYNYTSVWWLYSGVQLLSFIGAWLIGGLIVIYLINRPPLSRSQFVTIKDLLQRGERQQALELLEQKKKLKPYQADVFLQTLQNNPTREDLLQYAWHQAVDATDPAIKRKATRKPGTAASRVWLPAECPHCGATLDPSGVTWASSETAKCPYCDGIMKKQEAG